MDDWTMYVRETRILRLAQGVVRGLWGNSERTEWVFATHGAVWLGSEDMRKPRLLQAARAPEPVQIRPGMLWGIYAETPASFVRLLSRPASIGEEMRAPWNAIDIDWPNPVPLLDPADVSPRGEPGKVFANEGGAHART
jgi:dTDP-4-dehydrorhamnose 3,5-epimerase-like enzyme